MLFGEVPIQHEEHVHPGQSRGDGLWSRVTKFVRDDDATDARADAGGHHGGGQPIPFCAEHRQPDQCRNGAHVQERVEVEERLERRARGWFALSSRPRAEHAVKHRANAQHPHGTHRRGRSAQQIAGDDHTWIDEPQQVRSKGGWALTHADTTSGTDSSLVPEPSDDFTPHPAQVLPCGG